MGIPKFAKWLINRYPTILKKIKTDEDVPEIDNLYLDINGIIHNKSHNNSLQTMLEHRKVEEIYYDVFLYIDQLVHLIKPQKVLMISADGVAPRAKMNQQRTRRFRKTNLSEKEQEELKKSGVSKDKMFNSDCISGGTNFMLDLMKAFEYFIATKINSDPLWKNMKVVFSGSETPGEGEHKIVEYIRNCKALSDYDPQTRHCVYGLDADLIMLSLITHEASIAILREVNQLAKLKEVLFGKSKTPAPGMRDTIKFTDNFEFIYISILREYLELEFITSKDKMKELGVEFNIERILDDFVFFCFFIGNDFLPSLNTLDIDEGSLNLIIKFYSQSLIENKGYITHQGKINFKMAENIFSQLAKNELDGLKKMLSKLEDTCNKRKERRDKQFTDQKIMMKKKKINEKKIVLLENIRKDKSNKELEQYKKSKVKNKINVYKKHYCELMEKAGKKEYKFEDDVSAYTRKQNMKAIEKFHRNNEINNDTDTLTEIVSEDPKETEKKRVRDDYNKELNEKMAKSEVKEDLVQFFDEDKNRKKEFEKNTRSDPFKSSEDEFQKCLKKASQFLDYIKDENYFSDLNIDDFSDDEIGPITDIDIQSDPLKDMELYEEYQDMEKVFQQKLVDFYIKDVNAAKKFYYKEKLNMDLDTEQGKQEHKLLFRNYLEGLQWVMYYYYKGIPSWRWFYQFHYPPMISDFEKIKEFLDYDIDSSFSKDQAFTPYQSLLMILPEQSKNLLPVCYHSLYQDKDLKQYYPEKFAVDFNGKRMAWESIVILPFIPEKLVLQKDAEIRNKFEKAENCKEEEKHLCLKDYEIIRNSVGKSYIYSYSETAEMNVKTINQDLKGAKVQKIEYEVYQDLKNAVDANYAKKRVAYNFPSLRTNEYSFSYHKMVKDGNKNSRFAKKIDMICIHPVNKFNRLSENDFIAMFKNFLSQPTIYINYPFKQEAYMTGIYYKNQYFYLDEKTKKLMSNGRRISEEVLDTISYVYSKKRGVSMDQMEIFCEAYFFKRFARNLDGTLTKIYEEKPKHHPFEVTSLNWVLSDDADNLRIKSDNLKSSYENVAKEFPLKTQVIVLTKKNFGMVGKVEKYINNTDKDYDTLSNKNCSEYYDLESNYDLTQEDCLVSFKEFYKGILLEISVNEFYQLSNITDTVFARNMAKNCVTNYTSMERVAEQLKISTAALSVITSNFFVINSFEGETTKLADVQHWNIGLNLKAFIKGEAMILSGYSRSIYMENVSYQQSLLLWEFSDKAISLIKTYKEKFPYVFDSLEKHLLNSRGSRYFKVHEIFAHIENVEHLLNDTVIWIASTELKGVPFAKSTEEFLTTETLSTLVQTVLDKNAELGTKKKLYSTKLYVNPNYVFAENTPWTPMFLVDTLPHFELGDRVVNVCSVDKKYVPFGAKGTVTAVAEDYIEVVFDSSFFGGNSLNGKIKIKSGLSVRPLSVINLTRKPPVFLRRNINKYSPWNFSQYYNQKYNNKQYNQYLPKSYSNNYSDLKNEEGGYEDDYTFPSKSHSIEGFKGTAFNVVRKDREYIENYKDEKFNAYKNNSKSYAYQGGRTKFNENQADANVNVQSTARKVITRNKYENTQGVSEGGNVVFNNNAREGGPRDNNTFVKKPREERKKVIRKDGAGNNSNNNTNQRPIVESSRPKLFPEENLKPNQMYFFNNSKSNTDKIAKKGDNIIIK